VAVKFDADPALFFLLRGVDPADLLSSGAHQALVPAAQASLEGEDLSALFGIDLGNDAGKPAAVGAVASERPEKPMVRKLTTRKSGVKQPVDKKPAAKKPAAKKPAAKVAGTKRSTKKLP
jgi:uncharacterized Zn finger protein